MEEILKKAMKVCEEAELFAVTSEDTSVQFEANRLKHIQSSQSTSIALRIIKDGRIGYSTATGLEDSQSLIDMAVETAEFGMEAKFDFPAKSAYPGVEIFDPSIKTVPTEEMKRLGDAMITALTGDTPELLCEGGVSKAEVSVNIINSHGGQAEYKKSIFGIGIEGQLIRGTDMLFVGDSRSSCNPLLDTDIVTQEVLKQLERAREQAPVKTGTFPVIFTAHGIASALMMPLFVAFNGKTVYEGASPVGNKMGQVVFDEKFGLTDDPLIAFRPSSRPCDDEGTPGRKTPLIENGVVKSFLYDLQTAGLAGTSSTGNGRRGGGSLPSPSPNALVVTAGDTTFDEMVADIKEGLVVEQLMGASQGNVLGGDFSGNVLLGYKIENGKITGRVKDTMVSGNIYKLLKDIAAIGSESRWVGGMLNTPPIYLAAVSVASK
ncbi:TldD/PmbA family protein [Chloroflexota bacterium]